MRYRAMVCCDIPRPGTLRRQHRVAGIFSAAGASVNPEFSGEMACCRDRCGSFNSRVTEDHQAISKRADDERTGLIAPRYEHFNRGSRQCSSK
jgi:hypothetical protein